MGFNKYVKMNVHLYIIYPLINNLFEHNKRIAASFLSMDEGMEKYTIFIEQQLDDISSFPDTVILPYRAGNFKFVHSYPPPWFLLPGG